MQLIRDVIEWFSSETLSAFATIFPFLLLGLVGLYMLWLLVGYLRVSQVGIRESHPAQQAVTLPPAPDAPPDAVPGPTTAAVPRGVPYCAADGLAFPLGARFCTKCERDLLLDCATCGATLPASATSCYRCGTRTGVAGDTHPG